MKGVFGDVDVKADSNRIRRSVIIFERNDGALTRARGIFMQAEIDLSYVAALNLFLEIGLQKFLTRQLTDLDWQVIENHVLEAAKREAHDNNFAEINFAKLHRKLQNLKEMLSNAR